MLPVRKAVTSETSGPWYSDAERAEGLRATEFLLHGTALHNQEPGSVNIEKSKKPKKRVRVE
jgi:hypothetical protein